MVSFPAAALSAPMKIELAKMGLAGLLSLVCGLVGPLAHGNKPRKQTSSQANTSIYFLFLSEISLGKKRNSFQFTFGGL